MWSRYSPERQDALYQAKKTKRKRNKNGEISKKPDVVYTCACCKKEFKATEIQVDHIEAIGATPPFPGGDWNAWITKVFCKIENLQILCKPCHLQKTKEDKQNGKVHRSKKAARSAKKEAGRGQSKDHRKRKNAKRG